MYPLLIVISLVMALAQWPALQPFITWDARLIADGQWWRLLSGNFTHTNLIHLGMNTAGLWVIAFFFRHIIKPKEWSFILIAGSFFVGVTLLMSDINVYLGLSGTLHALFAYYALKETLGGRKSSWLLVIGVIAKVGYECVLGAPESTASMIDARVAVEAHLVGMLSGFAMGLVNYILTSRTSIQDNVSNK